MCVHQGVTVCLEAMRQAFPATDSLQRTTKFFYSPTFRQSEAGIPIGPNSSTPASSRHMLNLYTTPAPAFEVRDDLLSLVMHDWLTVFETNSTFHAEFVDPPQLYYRLSGSQWEGHSLPASPVCSQRSQCGNAGVQLRLHSLLCFQCFTGKI